MEVRSEKENVLYYTDGHHVTVTDTAIKVRKKWYRLNGITHHGFTIIPPTRIPAAVFMALGALAMIGGMAGFFPKEKISGALFMGRLLDMNDMAVAMGAIVLTLGVVLVVLIREKYAVSITTAEGDKKVVVSTSKEYISQIVNALNEAFFAKLGSLKESDPKRNFMVSGR